jgi:hypothetical protein
VTDGEHPRGTEDVRHSFSRTLRLPSTHAVSIEALIASSELTVYDSLSSCHRVLEMAQKPHRNRHFRNYR